MREHVVRSEPLMVEMDPWAAEYFEQLMADAIRHVAEMRERRLRDLLLEMLIERGCVPGQGPLACVAMSGEDIPYAIFREDMPVPAPRRR